VPQGSVFAPVLLVIYCADVNVISIARPRGLKMHASLMLTNTQLHFHADPTEVDNKV